MRSVRLNRAGVEEDEQARENAVSHTCATDERKAALRRLRNCASGVAANGGRSPHTTGGPLWRAAAGDTLEPVVYPISTAPRAD